MLDSLLYIASPSYSGSTLLTILLQQHPEIASVGELKASAFGDIDQYECSCGTRLLECPYWSAVVQSLNGNGVEFSLRQWQTHFTASAPIARRLLATSLKGPLLEHARRLGLLLVPSARAAHKALLDRNQAIIDAVCTHSGRRLVSGRIKGPHSGEILYRLWPAGT